MPSSRTSASRQNHSTTTTPDDDRLTSTLLTLNVLYQTHIHPLLPESIQPISSNISSLLVSSAPYLSQVIGLFRSVLSSALSAGGESKDSSTILSIGVLLVTLWFSMRIMNYIRRTIMGWVWLAIKLVLLLVVVQVGIYVNSYGWEKAVRDASWIGGIGWGLLEDFINQNNDGTQRQPRGTRKRGQKNYAYNQQAGAGRYG